MSKQELESLWRKRLESFGSEGLTARAWCAAQGIPQHQFHYWRRRLREVDSGKSKGDWLSLEVAPNDGGIVVRVGEAVIEVRSGFDASLLRAVVRALGSGPC